MHFSAYDGPRLIIVHMKLAEMSVMSITLPVTFEEWGLVTMKRSYQGILKWT